MISAGGHSMEPRYTLAEARAEIARLECARFSHLWDVIETPVRPLKLVCSRCSKSYKIADSDE